MSSGFEDYAKLLGRIEELQTELDNARDGWVPNGYVIPFRLLANWLVWLDGPHGKWARNHVTVDDIICKAKDAVGFVDRLQTKTLPISEAS